MVKRILAMLIMIALVVVVCILAAELTRVNPAITIVVLMSLIGVVLSLTAMWLDVKDEEDS